MGRAIKRITAEEKVASRSKERKTSVMKAISKR
jgi:hypothetical protein